MVGDVRTYASENYTSVPVDLSKYIGKEDVYKRQSTHSLGGKHVYKSDEMFRTTDGGKSWKPMFKTGYEYDYSKAPYTKAVSYTHLAVGCGCAHSYYL